MLFIIFQLGDDRYVLDAGQIEQILPFVSIKPIPQALHGVAGVFNYRGAPVPVIDLSELTLGRPARRRLSTRILVIHYDSGRSEKRLLGLVAEKAMQTVRRDTNDFVSTGVDSNRTAYLGPVATDAHGLLQWVDVKKLLPTAVRDVLFREVVETNGPRRV
jgi:chemotaxis-related protein WspB